MKDIVCPSCGNAFETICERADAPELLSCTCTCGAHATIEYRAPTNFERITQSPETLTEWYMTLMSGFDTLNESSRHGIKTHMIGWLNSPAESGDKP